MKRTEIAVLGAPPNGALRLELFGSPGEEGLALEYLHDQRQTGTLARVLGGRIGLGEVSVGVAVKIQRDVALSQEDRGSVAAKFDKERNVHRRLQAAGTGGRVVRQLEVWGGGDGNEADALGPCILCARARHGIAPKCPECNDPEAVLEELELTDDRGLRCPRCQRQFWSTPKTRDAVLDASLRRDPACHGCPQEQSPTAEGCRPSAVLLNFFRNRILLLERLDLDLDDYLRWRQEPSAAGPRAAARQAFAEHRRHLDARRAEMAGPWVTKIADLLRTADLFSEIVAGVEHLHGQGVAHLDLKPANFCLRFRGAELDVKVIDLGLSDDPNTLAYLRQAEGPLSLWTDYSAPEFRRPRSRPVAVDGCIREDACELSWPRSDAAAADLPLPGDVLLFEDRELGRYRFRVLDVRPGAEGRLMVQARAEPQHRPWRGERAERMTFGPEAASRAGVMVVLEKHCGFPADVFSLGMLLLALLAGDPEVADFREALPGVQIELEELAREGTALPGRALVQRLLARPSRHLQLFHAYARRLATFGVAQPMAEELLGLAMRATLRGEPGMFYLSDRGGDARPALTRLRADLDAVRAALRGGLATAQAAAVREARLTVLDQFRGRLLGHVMDLGAPLHQGPQGRLLFPALDLGGAGENYREAELAYFPTPSRPGAVLDRWERELTGPGGDDAAGRGWDFLVRYCRRVDLSPGPAEQFLERVRALGDPGARPGPSDEPARTEDGERLRAWLDEHQALAERLAWGPRFVGLWEGFLFALRDRLVTAWDRALRGRRLLVFRRRAVRVPLSRVGRAAVRDEEIGAALEAVRQAMDKAAAARRLRGQDFERALARWRVWRAGHPWLEALDQLETAALGQRRQVDARAASWEQEGAGHLRRIEECLGGLKEVLDRFDALLRADLSAEEVVARLSRSRREAVNVAAAAEAGRWLRQNWPPPGDCVESLFALWDLGVAEG